MLKKVTKLVNCGKSLYTPQGRSQPNISVIVFVKQVFKNLSIPGNLGSIVGKTLL